MPIELVSQVESSRQAMERSLAQRLERMRIDESARERQRLEEQQAAKALADSALAERAQLESIRNERLQNTRLQAERFEDRVESALAGRTRDNDVATQREVERVLADRVRTDGLQTYRAQSEPPPQPYVLDAQQAERVQTTRQAIERAETARLDRIEFSDVALVQLGY